MSEKRITPLVPIHGLGKELCDLLRAKLAVPEGVRSFSVHFRHDDAITVTCDYMPRVEDAPLNQTE